MHSDPQPAPTEPENPISLLTLNAGLKRVLEMKVDPPENSTADESTVELKVESPNIKSTQKGESVG